MLQNRVVFFTTKTLFLSVIYSIKDTNNNSPEEMKRKQRNKHPYYAGLKVLDGMFVTNPGHELLFIHHKRSLTYHIDFHTTQLQITH